MKVKLGRVLYEDLNYAFDIRARDDIERDDTEISLAEKLDAGRDLDLTEAEARMLANEAAYRVDFDCNAGGTYTRQVNRLDFDLGLLRPFNESTVHFGGVPPRIVMDGGRYEWAGWEAFTS